MPSRSILVLGKSGSGKSTSLRNLNPKTTVLFSPLGKRLPFKGSDKNYTVYNKEKNPNGNVIVTSESKKINSWLKYISSDLTHIKTVVIDDSVFLAAKELDRRKDEKGYDKFSDIAHDFLVLSETANTLRDDLTIYFMYHVTTEGDGILEAKTTKALSYGKMIDEKLASIEAQFELVFLAEKIVDPVANTISYKFKTRDAYSTVKTPIGMFDEERIDNDLNFINEAMRCYYEDNC